MAPNQSEPEEPAVGFFSIPKTFNVWVMLGFLVVTGISYKLGRYSTQAANIEERERNLVREIENVWTTQVNVGEIAKQEPPTDIEQALRELSESQQASHPKEWQKQVPSDALTRPLHTLEARERLALQNKLVTRKKHDRIYRLLVFHEVDPPGGYRTAAALQKDPKDSEDCPQIFSSIVETMKSKNQKLVEQLRAHVLASCSTAVIDLPPGEMKTWILKAYKDEVDHAD
jgi:hypothetical protein